MFSVKVTENRPEIKYQTILEVIMAPIIKTGRDSRELLRTRNDPTMQTMNNSMQMRRGYELGRCVWCEVTLGKWGFHIVVQYIVLIKDESSKLMIDQKLHDEFPNMFKLYIFF